MDMNFSKLQEILKDRGWDGYIASLTQWTWIWANFGRWWRTEEPGMLQYMKLQSTGHDLATEQQQQSVSEEVGQTWDVYKVFRVFQRQAWLGLDNVHDIII